MSFTNGLSRFMRNTILVSLHEQRQLGEHIICYEAAICYQVEWCEYECQLLILKKTKNNEKRISFQKILNAFPIYEQPHHTCLFVY